MARSNVRMRGPRKRASQRGRSERFRVRALSGPFATNACRQKLAPSVPATSVLRGARSRYKAGALLNPAARPAVLRPRVQPNARTSPRLTIREQAPFVPQLWSSWTMTSLSGSNRDLKLKVQRRRLDLSVSQQQVHDQQHATI
eukprot:366166-Chlamydomonas_euryale.AAC.16